MSWIWKMVVSLLLWLGLVATTGCGSSSWGMKDGKGNIHYFPGARVTATWYLDLNPNPGNLPLFHVGGDLEAEGKFEPPAVPVVPPGGG